MPLASSDPRGDLPRIDVDFNRLGQGGPNTVPLGDDAAVLARLGRLPVVGEWLLAVQEGDLDAVGPVRAEEIAGRRFWLLDIDPATLRSDIEFEIEHDRVPVQLQAIAVAVWSDPERLHLRLADGRELSVPLAWFPRLERATVAQRAAYRIWDGGAAIRWEEIDEDISVPILLGLPC